MNQNLGLARTSALGGGFNPSRLMRKLARPLMLVAGAIMVAVGIAMMTGKLTAFSH